MDIFKKCYDYKIVDEIKKKKIYPYFHTLQSKQAPVVKMKNKQVIMLGSNNYLGLTSDKRVINAGINAIKKYGSGVSGSRFLNGTLDLHIDLENKLSKFLKKEKCIIFSSGFNANLGVISSLVSRHDYVFCDRENHASIYDACKLSFGTMIRYKHNDMNDLEEMLKKTDPKFGKLIVTDGVFSMSGDICKLPEIVALAKKYGARVYVDDAHGFGVIGKHGRGTAEYFNLENEVDLIMGTFSKSLASIGGFVVANKKVINYIAHNSRPYIFSAALPAQNVACAEKALEIIEKENLGKKVIEITKYAKKMLIKNGIKIKDNSIVPIIPIYTYDINTTLKICVNLFNKGGVYVNPVIPPATPENECLIRISLMATHTTSIVKKAIEIIVKEIKKHVKY